MKELPMLKQQPVVFTNHNSNHSPNVSEEGPPLDVDKNELTPQKSMLPKNEKEVRASSEKFETLVEKSAKTLLKIHTVFPFDFFPDTIIVDENKVNIIHREFFFSQDIQSILIHHVKDVVVETSLFFATLKILPDGYNENWVNIPYLKKNDGIRVRRIIAGLLVGFKEGLDMSKVETSNLVGKIEAMGAALS